MNEIHEETVSPQLQMPSVGERLRQARESRSLTIEEAAEATSISKVYLRALEGNRFNDLPSQAYVKGFVKVYANYLKLPVDEIIESLPDNDTSTIQDEDKAESRPKKQTATQWARRFAMPLILLSALVISSFFLDPARINPVKSSIPMPQQELPPAPQQPVQAALSSSTIPQPVPTAPEPVAAKLENEPPPSLPQGPKDGFVVRMKVLKKSAITVTIDDTLSQGYQVTAGDLIEWKASGNLSFDLSDAGAVELELNGVPVNYSGTPGRSAHVQLGADGIRR